MDKIFQNLGGAKTTDIKLFEVFLKIDFLCIMLKKNFIKIFLTT